MFLCLFLRQCKPTTGFPGLRTFCATSRASIKRFTQQEDDKLVQLCRADHSIADISRITNRPISSVHTRLKRLLPLIGLEVPKSVNGYSTEEAAKLLRLREEGLDWDQIGLHFPRRKISTLQEKYYALKKLNAASNCVRKRMWISSEEGRVIFGLRNDTTPPTPWVEIARRLGNGRTGAAIQTYYNRHVPDKASRRQGSDPRHWTTAQKEELAECKLRGMSITEIATRMKKSNQAIHEQLFWLRHNISPSHPIESLPASGPWSAEHEEGLRALQPGIENFKEFANRIGRTTRAVADKWYDVRREDRRREEALLVKRSGQ